MGRITHGLLYDGADLDMLPRLAIDVSCRWPKWPSRFMGEASRHDYSLDTDRTGLFCVSDDDRRTTAGTGNEVSTSVQKNQELAHAKNADMMY